MEGTRAAGKRAIRRGYFLIGFLRYEGLSSDELERDAKSKPRVPCSSKTSDSGSDQSSDVNSLNPSAISQQAQNLNNVAVSYVADIVVAEVRTIGDVERLKNQFQSGYVTEPEPFADAQVELIKRLPSK